MSPLILIALTACDDGAPLDSAAPDRGDAPAHTAPAPTMKRLTQAQYRAILDDVFGDQIVVTATLEPDEAVDGLIAIGAGVSTISPVGVERYETAAFQVAEQAMSSTDFAYHWMACHPEDTVDRGCAEEILEPLGRQLWRRPLSDSELDRLLDLSDDAASTLGSFKEGLSFGIAALLQSPEFLYRIERGELVDGQRRLNDYEMASRLSFFLWNSGPDEALLDAAEAGELTTDDGLYAQIVRMLDDERAHDGVQSFFSDMYQLGELDSLSKDPLIFLHMNSDVGPAARTETLLGIDHLVFVEDGDFRNLMTTQWTWVDRNLAAIYNIPAPTPDGFGLTLLDPADGRRGLLGQASFLALQSHAVSTSVTLRGLFIQEVILCTDLPPPPAGVDTSIPEASEDEPTMRDRVARHLEDPACASCHQITDPMGLALENFDGLGRWRETENGVSIDPSGELEGEPFADAWELAGVLRNHRQLGPCLTQTMYEYAGGHSLDPGEEALVDWHAQGFEDQGFRVLDLMEDIALSPGFRTIGEVE